MLGRKRTREVVDKQRNSHYAYEKYRLFVHAFSHSHFFYCSLSEAKVEEGAEHN